MEYSEIVNWINSNSDKVIEDLEQDVKQIDTIRNGINKVKDSVLTTKDFEGNTRKQLYTTMKSFVKIINILRKMAMINMALINKNKSGVGSGGCGDSNTMDFFNAIFNNKKV